MAAEIEMETAEKKWSSTFTIRAMAGDVGRVMYLPLYRSLDNRSCISGCVVHMYFGAG